MYLVFHTIDTIKPGHTSTPVASLQCSLQVRDQTNDCYELASTAVALDLLRFFYKVLNARNTRAFGPISRYSLRTSLDLYLLVPVNLKCKIFPQTLWMPWDDDSDCEDWPLSHLATR